MFTNLTQVQAWISADLPTVPHTEVHGERVWLDGRIAELTREQAGLAETLRRRKQEQAAAQAAQAQAESDWQQQREARMGSVEEARLKAAAAQAKAGVAAAVLTLRMAQRPDQGEPDSAAVTAAEQAVAAAQAAREQADTALRDYLYPEQPQAQYSFADMRDLSSALHRVQRELDLLHAWSDSIGRRNVVDPAQADQVRVALTALREAAGELRTAALGIVPDLDSHRREVLYSPPHRILQGLLSAEFGRAGASVGHLLVALRDSDAKQDVTAG